MRCKLIVLLAKMLGIYALAWTNDEVEPLSIRGFDGSRYRMSVTECDGGVTWRTL